MVREKKFFMIREKSENVISVKVRKLEMIISSSNIQSDA